jgi:hypothetical protein
LTYGGRGKMLDVRNLRGNTHIVALTLALSCAVAGSMDAGAVARQPSPQTGAESRVASYRVESALARVRESSPPAVVLRSFSMAGRPHLLVVDPDTLDTSLVPAEGLHPEARSPLALRASLADTPYGRALEEARRNEGVLVDAGVTHLRPTQPGINLTVDLCPSSRPLDRQLFLALMDELKGVESPVPVAVAVTGVWMREHPADLAWLVQLDRTQRLAITWVNHSFHHVTSRTRPLASNFLLEPGTNATDEVLATERALIERGLLPSVFFRFPGLVSSRALVETVVSLGLVPLGSDAWLAKGEWPGNGSIVLVHGNGNEPLGVKRFAELLRQERSAVNQHRWLLLDLRPSVVNSERAR